jgi:hypothetical protein
LIFKVDFIQKKTGKISGSSNFYINPTNPPHLSHVFTFLRNSHSRDPGGFVSLSLRFSTQESATPVFPDFFASFVVVSFNGFNQLSQVLLVLVVDISEGNSGAGLSSDQLSESSLTFDDAVWNVHLSAESWKVDDDFDWIDVVGDENELSLFSFDEADDLVDSGGEHGFPGGWGVGFAFGSCLGSGNKSSFFLGFGFWSVFSGQLEDLSSVLFVQSLGELVDGRWDLQSLLEHLSLPLELDVHWPSNESGEISFWLKILTDAKVFGPFFKQWVVGSFLLDSLADWGSGSFFTSFSDHFVSF